MKRENISIKLLIAGIALLFSNPAMAVRNGALLRDNDYFTPVGVLWQPSDISSGSCSGTLITPRHVLTAAHCYLGQSLTYPQRFAFSVARQEARITQIKMLKEGRWKDYDLAILTLDREINSVKLPILEFNLLEEKGDLGDLFVVGFGMSDDQDQFGTKRAGLVAASEMFRAAADQRYTGQKFILSVVPGDENNQIGCPGDSGGAVMRIRPDGRLGLIGVNQGSPVIDPLSPCDSVRELFVTPVAEHAAWIKEHIK